MAKALFEHYGASYSQQSDYMLPDVKFLEQEEYKISI